MVAYAYDSSTCEAEAMDLSAPHQPGLQCIETLPLEQKKLGIKGKGVRDKRCSQIMCLLLIQV